MTNGRCLPGLHGILALLWAGLMSFSLSTSAASKPARFQSGRETVLSRTRVGPAGATLRTGTNGTPVDGITVEIPKGALAREITVTLSCNTGQLTGVRGDASGAFLRIDAGNVAEFEQPLKIIAAYDPVKWKNRTAVGYAIDNTGELAALDLGPKDGKSGTASFFTLVPLLFTWIYAPP